MCVNEFARASPRAREGECAQRALYDPAPSKSAKAVAKTAGETRQVEDDATAEGHAPGGHDNTPQRQHGV
eukprot:8542915-Alexandrium_andersonii.AAC.1